MGTVKITYFDSDAARRALDERVRDLAQRHPEIEEVILFGSLASGRPVPGSDADLLIVLTRSEHAFLDRIPAYVPAGLPIPVDVFPYTREEIERMTANGNSFIRAALESGIRLFQRDDKVPSHRPRPRSIGMGASGHGDSARELGSRRTPPRSDQNVSRMPIDRELLEILACPLDHAPVREEGDRLICSECGRRYPVRDGIPVMLVDEAELPEGGAP